MTTFISAIDGKGYEIDLNKLDRLHKYVKESIMKDPLEKDGKINSWIKQARGYLTTKYEFYPKKSDFADQAITLDDLKIYFHYLYSEGKNEKNLNKQIICKKAEWSKSSIFVHNPDNKENVIGKSISIEIAKGKYKEVYICYPFAKLNPCVVITAEYCRAIHNYLIDKKLQDETIKSESFFADFSSTSNKPQLSANSYQNFQISNNSEYNNQQFRRQAPQFPENSYSNPQIIPNNSGNNVNNNSQQFRRQAPQFPENSYSNPQIIPNNSGNNVNNNSQQFWEQVPQFLANLYSNPQIIPNNSGNNVNNNSQQFWEQVPQFHPSSNPNPPIPIPPFHANSYPNPPITNNSGYNVNNNNQPSFSGQIHSYPMNPNINNGPITYNNQPFPNNQNPHGNNMQNTNGFFTKKSKIEQPSKKITFSLPSEGYLFSVKGLPSGLYNEFQDSRLQRITDLFEKNMQKVGNLEIHKHWSVGTTLITDEWLTLFQYIKESRTDHAILILNKIVENNDKILNALLQAHTKEYIIKFIQNSCKIKSGLHKEDERDIAYNKQTFEFLIYELAHSLEAKGICFSVGLPSHHALTDRGSGFCLINKTAILALQSQERGAIPFIIGMDVNRDNGINAILAEKSTKPFFHIDVFDSRVYPNQKVKDVEKLLKPHGFTMVQENNYYVFGNKERNQCYYLVDLSRYANRQEDEIHPVMVLTKRLMDKFKKSSNKPIDIYLPTGWDSSILETADCSTRLDSQRHITKLEQYSQRFTNKDFEYFYKAVFSKMNHPRVKNFFVITEGGYNKQVIENQVKLMMSTFFKHVIPAEEPKPEQIMNLC